MKRHLFLFALNLFGIGLYAQNSAPPEPSKISWYTGIGFENLALPFQDIPSHFSNPGLVLGVQRYYGASRRFFQQAQLGYQHNRDFGSNYAVYSHFGWEQQWLSGLSSRLYLGLGWRYSNHPVDAMRFNNGIWEASNKGKSQLSIPLGLSLKYSKKATSLLSPFLNYEVNPSLFYNQTIPAVLFSKLTVGTFINL